jgi:hypothetical protein
MSAVLDGKEPGVNLDFYYQLVNFDEHHLGGAHSLALPFFAPFSASVGQTHGFFQFFLSFEREWASVSRDAKQITFVAPGEGSLDFRSDTLTMVIRTNAQHYRNGIGEVTFTNGFVEYLPTYQPAIPEPGTNALIAAGLGLMAFVMRRRNKKDKTNV